MSSQRCFCCYRTYVEVEPSQVKLCQECLDEVARRVRRRIQKLDADELTRLAPNIRRRRGVKNDAPTVTNRYTVNCPDAPIGRHVFEDGLCVFCGCEH